MESSTFDLLIIAFLDGYAKIIAKKLIEICLEEAPDGCNYFTYQGFAHQDLPPGIDHRGYDSHRAFIKFGPEALSRVSVDESICAWEKEIEKIPEIDMTDIFRFLAKKIPWTLIKKDADLKFEIYDRLRWRSYYPALAIRFSS